MKKNINKILYGIILLVAVFFIWTVYSDNHPTSNANQNVKDSSKVAEVQKNTKPAEKVQIYEFHSTNRCYSCITMGEYVKAMVEESFQSELKSGKIEFKEINVDLPENKAIATKFKAAGTSLFINAIIDGEDNIQEEVQAWRLLEDQKKLSDYLSSKIRGIIGETVSMETKDNMEKSKITFYSGDNCPECINVEKYLTDNNVKDKLAFEEKNINKNQSDSEQMAEDALQCDVEVESFDVPFLWADGTCYLGEKDIINFFEQKLS